MIQRTYLCAIFAIGVMLVSAFTAGGLIASPPDRLSVDYENEEIRTIIRDVADKFEINVVIPDSLNGRASLKLREVTWPQVFHILLTPVGYTFTAEDNIIKIISLDYQSLRPGKRDTIIPNWVGDVLLSSAGLFLVVPVVVLNLFLFVGVLRNRSRVTPRFAPHVIWALLVLTGGVIPLLVYWLIHMAPLTRIQDKQEA